MLRTRICELLDIEHPIIQASIGPWSSAELVAAVSGSVGTSLWSAENVRKQILRVRELTDGSFAVNHVVRPFNEEVFALTLEARPKVVSFAWAIQAIWSSEHTTPASSSCSRSIP